MQDDKKQLKSITTKIQPENSYITDVERTFDNYRNAVESAQDIRHPNRTYLMDIYEWVSNEDTHLRTILKQRRSRVLSQPFTITNKSGNPVSKVTDMFNDDWFFQVVKYILDAQFYGNSLIEINKSRDGSVMPLLIDRRHVIPEFKMVKSNPYVLTGDINYNQPAYSKKLIDVNNDYNSRNLGELRGVALQALAKIEGLYSYARYVNIFGIPMRVATTDSQDYSEIRKIKRFLKDLGSSSYMVKNSMTDIEFKENNGNQNQVHKDYIDFLNKEMSKAILGQTMTTEDGGSYSQSKVHQSESYNITANDISFIESVVNNSLLPSLRNIGILNDSKLYFKMERPETSSLGEKIKRDQFLVDNFDIDKEYFENRYNVKIKGIKNGN